MKSTNPKTKPNTQHLPVLRTGFELLTVLKAETLTKKGKIRKSVENGLVKMIRYEAHKFIDAGSDDEILAQSKIEWEDVEVLDETNG